MAPTTFLVMMVVVSTSKVVVEEERDVIWWSVNLGWLRPRWSQLLSSRVAHLGQTMSRTKRRFTHRWQKFRTRVWSAA